jgi:hypothetical protein
MAKLAVLQAMLMFAAEIQSHRDRDRKLAGFSLSSNRRGRELEIPTVLIESRQLDSRRPPRPEVIQGKIA